METQQFTTNDYITKDSPYQSDSSNDSAITWFVVFCCFFTSICSNLEHSFVEILF